MWLCCHVRPTNDQNRGLLIMGPPADCASAAGGRSPLSLVVWVPPQTTPADKEKTHNFDNGSLSPLAVGIKRRLTVGGVFCYKCIWGEGCRGKVLLSSGVSPWYQRREEWEMMIYHRFMMQYCTDWANFVVHQRVTNSSLSFISSPLVPFRCINGNWNIFLRENMHLFFRHLSRNGLHFTHYNVLKKWNFGTQDLAFQLSNCESSKDLLIM